MGACLVWHLVVHARGEVAGPCGGDDFAIRFALASALSPAPPRCARQGGEGRSERRGAPAAGTAPFTYSCPSLGQLAVMKSYTLRDLRRICQPAAGGAGRRRVGVGGGSAEMRAWGVWAVKELVGGRGTRQEPWKPLSREGIGTRGSGNHEGKVLAPAGGGGGVRGV